MRAQEGEGGGRSGFRSARISTRPTDFYSTRPADFYSTRHTVFHFTTTGGVSAARIWGRGYVRA